VLIGVHSTTQVRHFDADARSRMPPPVVAITRAQTAVKIATTAEAGKG